MSAILTSRAPPRRLPLEIIARVLKRLALKRAPSRRPHDWREIEAVRLDYETRKAEIGILVRSRSA